MIRAFIDGLRRVWRAPWVLAGLSLWIVAGTIPLSWMPPSPNVFVGHDSGFIDRWLTLLGLPTGWSSLFVSLMGHDVILRDPSSGVQAFQEPLMQLVVLQIATALFLDGGILDRLARNHRVGADGFFAACGGCFGRLVRMGIVAVPLYWVLFAYEPPWLAIAAALLIGPIFGYAKIRAVVEDRRSALGSLVAAVRFVSRHPVAVLGLQSLNALLFVLAMELLRGAGGWLMTAPPAAASLALFALLNAAISLQSASSSIALFQNHLAHAGYTAAPVPKWPDSPAAEAIRLMD